MPIAALQNNDSDSRPFGDYEEEAIISLILDHPDFFGALSRHLSHELFHKPEVQLVAANILDYFNEYDVFPTRGMLRDNMMRSMTVDDSYAEDVLAIIDRKSDPREIPALKERLLDWARNKAYSKLYTPETIERFNSGDTQYLHDVIEEASRIQDIGTKGLWFFDELERLFIEDDKDHFTTGMYQLDQVLDEGGPGRKEMVVTMAPTGVGKSIFLVNQALANVVRGCNVLYITLELSDLKSALRTIGALSKLKIMDRHNSDTKAKMIKMATAVKASGAGDLVIFQFPPDEVSVNEIYALIDELRRTKGWIPDVIVIDYLELMTSRKAEDNKDEYKRQKACSTQLRGLAVNENVVVFSATQTNRSGNNKDDEMLDVTKIAESYGKSMAMDYLISINQNEEEYNEKPARARVYVAKNRNGPKFVSIDVTINYETMRVEEIGR